MVRWRIQLVASSPKKHHRFSSGIERSSMGRRIATVCSPGYNRDALLRSQTGEPSRTAQAVGCGIPCTDNRKSFRQSP